MGVEADVRFVDEHRMARVDADPDLHLRSGRPPVRGERVLSFDSSANSRFRFRERREELVGAAVDLVAADARDGRSKQLAVLVEDASVAVAELVDEARRVLDIGEEQRHVVGWELEHGNPAGV